MFAVVVRFQIKNGMMSGFLPLVKKNAHGSLQNEPDCHQFDVCTDEALPDIVFLYEIYSDRQAFDAHLGSAHFKEFDSAVSEMIVAKDVETYARVDQ